MASTWPARSNSTHELTVPSETPLTSHNSLSPCMHTHTQHIHRHTTNYLLLIFSIEFTFTQLTITIMMITKQDIHMVILSVLMKPWTLCPMPMLKPTAAYFLRIFTVFQITTMFVHASFGTISMSLT